MPPRHVTVIREVKVPAGYTEKRARRDYNHIGPLTAIDIMKLHRMEESKRYTTLGNIYGRFGGVYARRVFAQCIQELNNVAEEDLDENGFPQSHHYTTLQALDIEI